MKTTSLLAFALVAALAPLAPAAAQMPPSARQAVTLETELIVAAAGDARLQEWAAWRGTLETLTEIRPDMPAIAQVRVRGCRAEAGACRVSVDYTVYGPDAAVVAQEKLLPVVDGTAAPTLEFTLTDGHEGGLYRVVATVRDLNARRVERMERIFSLRLEGGATPAGRRP